MDNADKLVIIREHVPIYGYQSDNHVDFVDKLDIIGQHVPILEQLPVTTVVAYVEKRDTINLHVPSPTSLS